MEESLNEKRKILIIEDNRAHREILSMMLSSDYEIMKAESRKQGMDFLREQGNDISLVILDILMPFTTCYEFLQNIKADPFLKTIPVIIATGSTGPNEEERCLNLGAADFITKPYKPTIVRSRIRNIIALRESASAISAIEYDDLTGLYTRQAFIHHVGMVLKRNPRKRYSLVFSDIDDFKLVNEQFGELYGDSILAQGASFLKPAMKQGIPVGRYGGDQFVMLLEYDPEHMDKSLLENTINEITDSFSLPGLELRVGIYNDVDHNVPVSVLCDRAKLAARSISHQFGKRIAFYDESLQKKQNFRKQLETDMQKAYEEEQFKVYYQPKHDTVTGKLVGAEALIRWIHPELGFLPPADFIEVFEKTGFITYADYYVWRRTCSNLRRWIDKGISVVPVSVNTSKKDYDYPDYLNMVKIPIEKNHLNTELLHLEITESLFAQDPKGLAEKIQACRDMGLKIELDDFGTGFSSLNILSKLPLDVMKLDGSFMKELQDGKKNGILSYCIELGHSLGFTTIAEGVETEEQRNLVKSLHCDQIQGYYFSEPLTEEAFEKYMVECAAKENTEEEVSEDSAVREYNADHSNEWVQKKVFEENLRVTAALSQDYSAVMLINCDDKSFRILKMDENINAASLTPDISFDEFMQLYLQNFVLSEYGREILQFSEIDKVLQYFAEGHSSLTVRYKVKPNKAGQTNFEIRLVPFLDGKENQIIFGSRCIDGMVSRQDALSALSKDYKNVYLIHPDHRMVHVLKYNGYLTDDLGNIKTQKEYPYDEMIEGYVNESVYTDDQERIRNELQYENVIANVTKEHDYVGTYRCMEDGEIRNFRYRIVLPVGSNDLVAGFQKL